MAKKEKAKNFLVLILSIGNGNLIYCSKSIILSLSIISEQRNIRGSKIAREGTDALCRYFPESESHHHFLKYRDHLFIKSMGFRGYVE